LYNTKVGGDEKVTGAFGADGADGVFFQKLLIRINGNGGFIVV
jgi:hypothetical protein